MAWLRNRLLILRSIGEWLGEEVALKALRNIGKMDPRTARYFAKEIEIWRSLQVRTLPTGRTF